MAITLCRDRLRVALAVKRMSQRQLAVRLNLNASTLNGWLTGAYHAPSGLRERIELVLGLESGALRPKGESPLKIVRGA